MTSLRLNGRDLIVANDPMTPLLDVLREEVGDLTPKPGCREGSCGACAVLLDGEPTISCLLPVGRVAGHEVTTLEGLTASDGSLHNVQQAFERSGAVQCGICTPGMLMSVRAMLDEERDWTRAQVQRELANNLCRCTGYSKILDAVGQVLRREATDGA